MFRELKQKLRNLFQKAVKFNLLSTVLFICICLLSERNPIDIFRKKTVQSDGNDTRSDSLISISILLPCFYLTAYFLPKVLAIGGMILVGIFFRNSPLLDEFFLVHSETSAFFQKLAYILIIFRSGFSMEVKDLVKMRLSLFSIVVLLVIGEIMLICLFSVFILDYNWLIGLALGSLLSGASPLVVDGWTQRITDDVNKESFPDSLKDQSHEILKTLRSVLRVGGALSEMVSICTFMTTLRFVFAKEDCFQAVLIPLPFEIFFAFLAGLFGGFMIRYCSEPRRYFDYSKTEDEDRISFLKSSILSTVLILTGSFSLIISGEMIGCFVFGPIAVFFFGLFSRITMKKKRNHIYARVKTQLSLLCTFFLVPLLFGLLGFHLNFEMVNKMFGEPRLLYLITLVAIILFIKLILTLFARRPIVGTRKLLFVFLLLPKATPQAILGAVFLDRAFRENRVDLEETGHFFLIASILSIVLLSPAGMIKVKSLKDKKLAYERALLHFKNFKTMETISTPHLHREYSDLDLDYEVSEDDFRLGYVTSAENPYERLTLPQFLWKEYLKKCPKFDPTLNRTYDDEEEDFKPRTNTSEWETFSDELNWRSQKGKSGEESEMEKMPMMDRFTSKIYSAIEMDEQEQSTSRIEDHRKSEDFVDHNSKSLTDYQYAISMLLNSIERKIEKKVKFDENAQVIPEENKFFVQTPKKLSALERVRKMRFGKSKASEDSTVELNPMTVSKTTSTDSKETLSTIVRSSESSVSRFDPNRESLL